MVFSRIKTNGWQTNERLTSTQMNSLDIDHARAIDKTGETSAGGGGVSGEIDFKSGSSIQMQSGSQLSLASGSTGAMAGAVSLLSGGSLTTNSGSNLNMNGTMTTATGSLITLQGPVNLSGGSSAAITFGNSSSATFGFGATLNIASTGVLNTIGAQTVMTDNKPPVFSAAQTRTIVQPLLVNPVQNTYSFDIFEGIFSDAVSASYNLPLTKLINGATLSSIQVLVSPTGTPSTNGTASISLWKRNQITQAVSQLGSTVHAPGSFTALYTMNISSISEVIDDSVNSYYVLIQSASDQSLLWGTVLTNFTNISKVGQI